LAAAVRADLICIAHTSSRARCTITAITIVATRRAYRAIHPFVTCGCLQTQLNSEVRATPCI
jgi:hydroxymethylpyrimidine/phosphomethylpyrimidine kinase